MPGSRKPSTYDDAGATVHPAGRRWVLGLLTFWPPLYIVFFLVVVGIATIAGGGEPDDDLPIPEVLLFGLHLGTMIVLFALQVVYIRDAYRSTELPDDRRTFWAVTLFMGNVIAMPVYWWLFMRPNRSTDASSSASDETVG